MGATSYPGMTQPFSMSHSTNMGSVGVRQDSMSKFIILYNIYVKPVDDHPSDVYKPVICDVILICVKGKSY